MTFFCVLLLAAAAGSVQEPQNPPATRAPTTQHPADTSTSDGSSDDLPVSVDRIRSKLSEPPGDQAPAGAVRLSRRSVGAEDHHRRHPWVRTISRGRSRQSLGGMTHQEFLDLVTPKDVQGYAAFSNGEAAMVAATSFATHSRCSGPSESDTQIRRSETGTRARSGAQGSAGGARGTREARIKAGLPPK